MWDAYEKRKKENYSIIVASVCEKMNESIKNRSEKNRGIHSKSKKSEIINSFIQFPILKK